MITMPPSRSWERLLPETRGILPNGAPLRRTQASCPPGARVLFIGAYPAAIRVSAQLVAGTRMMLPLAVEEESFVFGSASGKEIENHYLAPLRLCRAESCFVDLLPYFLANTSKSKSGRSMADNIRCFEIWSGVRTGIDPRPAPQELVTLTRSMPGNVDRLRDVVHRVAPLIVFTLGLEAAAFVRGESFRDVEHRADRLLYAPALRVDLLGWYTNVVHLVHPHLFIRRNEKWIARHRAWVAESGTRIVDREVLASS